MKAFSQIKISHHPYLLKFFKKTKKFKALDCQAWTVAHEKHRLQRRKAKQHKTLALQRDANSRQWKLVHRAPAYLAQVFKSSDKRRTNQGELGGL